MIVEILTKNADSGKLVISFTSRIMGLISEGLLEKFSGVFLYQGWHVQLRSEVWQMSPPRRIQEHATLCMLLNSPFRKNKKKKKEKNKF